MDREPHSGTTRRSSATFIWILMVSFMVTAYLLIWEHRVHLDSYLDYLPFLVLIACSAIYLFIHRSDHGHHQRSAGKIFQGSKMNRSEALAY